MGGSRRHRLERFLVSGRQLGLPFVLDCALLDAETAFPLESHSHDGYEICYLLSGETRWVLGKEEVLYLSGEAFSVIQPRVPHFGLFHRIDPCELVWLVLKTDSAPGEAESPLLGRDLLSHMDAVYRNAGNTVQRGDRRLRASAEVFAATLRSLRYGRLDANRRAWLQTSVMQIIMAVHDLLRGRRQTASRSMADIVSRCDRFIQQHLAEPIGARDLVKHVNVHPSTFFVRFKQQAGMTPADYLRRARIQRARELLVRTNRSITEVALDCGFSSSQHFADCFKEYTGTQPSRFRREFRAPRLSSG